MPSLTFTIPGKPFSQPRPRARRNLSSNGPPVFMRPGTSQRKEEKSLQVYAREAMIASDVLTLACPVSLKVAAWFTYPVSRQRKRNPLPMAPHAQKPDADNLLKHVKDACSRIVWVDDALVFSALVQKFWAPQEGGEARVEVTIEWEES